MREKILALKRYHADIVRRPRSNGFTQGVGLIENPNGDLLKFKDVIETLSCPDAQQTLELLRLDATKVSALMALSSVTNDATIGRFIHQILHAKNIEELDDLIQQIIDSKIVVVNVPMGKLPWWKRIFR